MNDYDFDHPYCVFGNFEDWDDDDIEYLIQELRRGYCDESMPGSQPATVTWIPTRKWLQ